MLFSISVTGKSSSKWLDKLRSSKGFLSGADDLDLEQFLNQNSSPSNTEQESSSTSTPDPNLSGNDPPELHRNQSLEAQNSDEDGDTPILSLMSNVLAELFVMGNYSNNLPKFKKSSRKQRNPKFYAFNLDCPKSNNNESGSPITDDNCGVGMTKDRRRSDEQLKLVGNEEEEKGCVNLSGFSRTEITVIDTSFATWKFEKMLFRKKNVWKVRDKKGNTVSLGKKKKKRKANANLDDQYSNGTEEKKKQKVLHGQCSLSKKGCEEALDEEHHQPNKSDMHGKSSKKNQETSLQVARRNSQKENSSVILIKGIPTSKKIETSLQTQVRDNPRLKLKAGIQNF